MAVHPTPIRARARSLTPRQREVIQLVAQGSPNKDIARRLGISEQGVKAHVSRLLERYGAGNRVELVRITRAWEEADARTMGSLGSPIRNLRDRLDDGGIDELASGGLPADAVAEAERMLSPGMHPEIVSRIAQLARTLRELDVAIVLAQELPDEGAASPIIDLVRRRVSVAKELADGLIETLGARADAL